MNNAYAIILAGGKGERFWPLSTSRHPKQVLQLVGDESLIAQAVHRLKGLVTPDRVLVITNADLVAVCAEALPEVPRENIIGEPMGRDTAAAIALGTAIAQARDPKAVCCVLTADQVMQDEDLFRSTLAESMKLAMEQPVLITIGIAPTEPSTGYGYIERGAALREAAGIQFFKASRFVEKPARAVAEQYVQSGRYFWNSGMFVWTVANIIHAFRKHRPQLADMLDRFAGLGKIIPPAAVRAEYEKLEKISIDYAVMEKADNVVMARGTFRWDDVGSWPALERHFPATPEGNVFVGDAAGVDAAGNIVVSKGHLVALVGVKDMVVVHTPGATLVCPKDRAQDIKKMVEQLKGTGRYNDLL